MHRLAMLALLTVPATALAQDGPSFDCSEASTSAEDLVCEDADLAALDRRLSERFAAAVAVARGLDSGAEETENTLRAYQRGWVSGRDECWKEDDLRSCVEGEYLFREGLLVAEFLLEEPVSVTEYACGGAAGPMLTVYAFDTELPSLRVETGDTVDVGASAGPSMPGTFWMRELGSLTLLEGGAELTDPYGDTSPCTPAG